MIRMVRMFMVDRDRYCIYFGCRAAFVDFERLTTSFITASRLL